VACTCGIRHPGKGVRWAWTASRWTSGALAAWVVVPPSIRPSGPHAGKAYSFIQGSWVDLRRLRPIKPEALKAALPAPLALPLEAVSEGRRGDSLFLACLDQAPHCGTFEDLLDVARTINDDYEPSLLDAEVVKAVRSTWRYETEERNWRGYRGQGAQVIVSERVLSRLLTEHPKHGSDALALYVKLRAAHGGRVERGDTFAVAARAMAHQVLPWSEYRIRRATKTLADFGLIERVRDGGTGKGDAAQYTFRSPPPTLVSEMNTNVTRHPPPWASG
jgi:hypothetical protein